jgi:hypothetical protein
MSTYKWITRPEVRILLPHQLDGSTDVLELVGDLGWQDNDGYKLWLPEGWRWNGSSIPEFAWPLIGHPLTPSFLYASALHDAGCRARTEPSHIVHKRFYYGLRASGVSWRTAYTKYAIVREFGPSFPGFT